MDTVIDVAGLGNALVDALVRVDDDGLLAELDLTKGLMHPVDHDTWSHAYERVKERGVELHPGGSCANTVTALALMGARTVFCGQVGGDDLGRVYAERLADACGGHALHVAGERNTGKCLSLVSADAERTMLTDLGAAIELPAVGPFVDQIRQARLLYVTGYLLLGGPMVQATWDAMDIAREAGVPIAVDVADPFVVATVGDALWRALRDYASIAFLNAEEATAMTGLPAEEAIVQVAEAVEVAVVKLGSAGSLVRAGEVTHRIDVHLVEAVDTTGAGDAYAAGFVYGWLKGWDLERAGDLGSRVASRTVLQMGAVCRDLPQLQQCIEAVEAGSRS